MTIRERERIETRPTEKRPSGPRTGLWTLMAAAVAIVAIVAATVAVVLQGRETAVDEPVATVESLYTERERLMMRLANQGYIPREAVDWELIELKRLVNRGLVPAQALEPRIEPVEPLYTERDRLMLDLVNRGLIPRQSIDWEEIELKRLVNLGLVPRQALD